MKTDIINAIYLDLDYVRGVLEVQFDLFGKNIDDDIDRRVLNGLVPIIATALEKITKIETALELRGTNEKRKRRNKS